jgi:protein-tyrosine-phosphatase
MIDGAEEWHPSDRRMPSTSHAEDSHVGRALGRPVIITVVCSANRARSPVVAALLDREAARAGVVDQVRVESAGLHATPGSTVIPEVLTAGNRLGLQLAGHRSRPLTMHMAGSSALVITLTEAQRQAINRRSNPAAVHRTFTLRELDRLLHFEAHHETPHDSLEERIQRLSRLRPLAPRPKRAEDVADPIANPGKLVPQMFEVVGELVPRVAAGLFGAAADPHGPDLPQASWFFSP